MAAALASIKPKANGQNAPNLSQAQSVQVSSILPPGVGSNARSAVNVPASVSQTAPQSHQNLPGSVVNFYQDSQNLSSMQNLAESEHQNYLNFADPNDLKILKAKSVNQKYMTELINN